MNQTMYERYQEYLKWLNEPQQISDEEIELNASSYCLTAFNDGLFDAFIAGAKWYQQKVNQNK